MFYSISTIVLIRLNLGHRSLLKIGDFVQFKEHNKILQIE